MNLNSTRAIKKKKLDQEEVLVQAKVKLLAEDIRDKNQEEVLQ